MAKKNKSKLADIVEQVGPVAFAAIKKVLAGNITPGQASAAFAGVRELGRMDANARAREQLQIQKAKLEQTAFKKSA